MEDIVRLPHLNDLTLHRAPLQNVDNDLGKNRSGNQEIKEGGDEEDERMA